jgi:hypothetical protein
MSELADALKMKAICESGNHAEAAAALIAAATSILSLRFPPDEVVEILVDVGVESLAEQMRRTPLLAMAQAGHA